ncbi:helix-turn-helix transcriptional regulator [Nocardia huaxiensis]|uniref:Helix-turn-helix transcriptional regulator n=1 Tax=Nocardia huaxiensis TaxID=2755382 RepID=A0A7D6VCL1_9NOCA|nr:TetR/AcrR family transcriptional regulator [Nocardia huaxiensis]QLY29075.1 helix-turn-helix transcriptional regulator [Nocardia huaxiensis]
MASEQRKERADAARNRRAILDATRTLLAEHGADGVTMDRVAAAAGVGKGTVFHRFGNRAGLLHALLSEPAENLMAAIAEGPPPLGPGAPASDRLLAFVDAMITMAGDHVELMAASRTAVIPPHPRTAEIHAVWFRHIAALLNEVRPDLDADMVGPLLLSMISTDYAATLARAGEVERVRAGILEITRSLLSAEPAGTRR